MKNEGHYLKKIFAYAQQRLDLSQKTVGPRPRYPMVAVGDVLAEVRKITRGVQEYSDASIDYLTIMSDPTSSFTEKNNRAFGTSLENSTIQRLINADSAIRSAIQNIKHYIPDFTAAKNDKEMFVVATELSMELAFHGKVLQIEHDKGIEILREQVKELTEEGEFAADMYTMALDLQAFDLSHGSLHPSRVESRHLATEDRKVEMIDAGGWKNVLQEVGDTAIRSVDENAISLARKDPNEETRDIMGDFRVIDKDGNISVMTIKLTFIKSLGLCMSRDESSPLLQSMGLTVLGVTIDDPNILVPEGNGGPDDKELNPESLIKKYYNWKDMPEKQRHGVLKDLIINGETHYYPPIKRDYVLDKYRGLYKMFWANRNNAQYRDNLESDARFIDSFKKELYKDVILEKNDPRNGLDSVLKSATDSYKADVAAKGTSGRSDDKTAPAPLPEARS